MSTARNCKLIQHIVHRAERLRSQPMADAAQIDDVKADAQFVEVIDIAKIAFGNGGEARREQPDTI
jgi:hypothetical protein